MGFFLFFFACGILVPTPGIEPGLLQWIYRVPAGPNRELPGMEFYKMISKSKVFLFLFTDIGLICIFIDDRFRRTAQ